MPKLVDCFIFYNEIALLKYRLHLLYSTVDYFVCVEANVTHTNISKPSYFTLYKKEFEPYLDKIIHIFVDDMPNSSSPWDFEFHQRNAIDRGLEKLQLDKNDTILISDVDEIPDPAKLTILKKIPLKTTLALDQKLYYYHPTILQQSFWNHGKAIPYHLYCTKFNKLANAVRETGEYNIMNMCGWHFSYFGSTEFIMNKIKMYTHQENNISSLNNKQNIEDAIKNVKDIFGRNIYYDYIPIEKNTYLPKDIHLLLQWLEEFKEVI